MVDTHAHLNFKAFNKDYDEVIKRAQAAGVTKIINVGADLDSSQKAVEIAQKYNDCYASVGIHPHHACNYRNTEKSMKTLKKLVQNPKVVAIGETGLDYHPYHRGGIADPQKQKELFLVQIELAQRLNLPLIFHCRSASAPLSGASADKQAHKDILEMIKPYPLTGVFHCFSGGEEFLEEVLKMGFFVGFDGNITYKGVAKGETTELKDLVKLTPIERLLLETDSPFLPPEPYRGSRNEPVNVIIIAKFIAKIKGLTFEEVSSQTTKNAKTLFQLSL